MNSRTNTPVSNTCTPVAAAPFLREVLSVWQLTCSATIVDRAHTVARQRSSGGQWWRPSVTPSARLRPALPFNSAWHIWGMHASIALSGSDVSSSQSSCAKHSVSHPATILSKVEAWHGNTWHLTASRE